MLEYPPYFGMMELAQRIRNPALKEKLLFFKELHFKMGMVYLDP